MPQQRYIFLSVDNTSKITILTLQWLNLVSFKGKSYIEVRMNQNQNSLGHP